MALVSKNFSDIITFTRASSATFTGSNGLIQSATTNTPRFDYDPVTLAAKGLLIEEQRTNLLLQSETFDNAYWALLNATVTANTAVAPSGATSADKLVETAATGDHRILNNLGETVTLGATYTWSVFAKAGERTSVRVINNNAVGATFDLTNGASSNVSGGITATSINAGNGWYRLAITGTAATTTERIGILLVSGGNTNYTGDGTSGAFIWGAQLEAGSFATSYIPTVASQVTRSADVASVNTLSPWYNATEGTLYAEASSFGLGAAGNFVANFTDGTLSNRGGIYAISTGSAVAGYMVSGGVIQADISASGAAGSGAVFKAAFAFRTNNFAVSVNSSAALTDTSGTVATVDRLGVGTINNGNPLNGHIRRITYYPRRLSNTELQAITA